MTKTKQFSLQHICFVCTIALAKRMPENRKLARFYKTGVSHSTDGEALKDIPTDPQSK